jgi:hypothetical protein
MNFFALFSYGIPTALQVVNDRWEVALGLTDGSGFQQAKGPAAIH